MQQPEKYKENSDVSSEVPIRREVSIAGVGKMILKCVILCTNGTKDVLK